MSAVTATFLAVGGFAVLLMLLSLASGAHLHLGHLHFGHLHLGRLHLGHLGQLHVGHAPAGPGHDGGAGLSLPVLAGFVGAFGFAGAIASSLADGHGAVTVLAAVTVGVLAAVPSAWIAGKLVDAALNMPTDATLSSNDLIGAIGVVITPVPAGGYGEVRLAVAGQHLKFNARSQQPLALGTHVFVIEVPTPTSVLVESTPSVQ
jgi:membrane protein implicated in regulation of membrane protease activity